jgi:flagellar export protein FliJ
MERMRLLAISAAIVRLRQEISAIERDVFGARKVAQSKLAAGVVAAEIHFEMLAASVRMERRSMLQRQLAELEAKERAQRNAYKAARHKREILQNLRDRRWDEYRLEAARREQSQLDELFLLHRGNAKPAETE